MAIKIIKKQVYIDDVPSEAQFSIEYYDAHLCFLKFKEAKELMEALEEKLKQHEKN